MGRNKKGFYDFGAALPADEDRDTEEAAEGEEHIGDELKPSVEPTDRWNAKTLKLLIVVLAVVSGLAILANVITLPLIWKQEKQSEVTTNAVTTSTEKVTTTHTTQTTSERTTTTEIPPVTRTATSVSYTLTNEFNETTTTEEEVKAEYYLFVATNPDRDLLNASNTWASVTQQQPPFGYLALQCPDFFETEGCTEYDSRKKRSKAQKGDIVPVKIGIEECDENDKRTICNGKLNPGTTYYSTLRRIIKKDIQDSQFTEIQTAVFGTWSQWSSWSECDQSCGGGIQRQTRQCEHETKIDPFCDGSASRSTACNTKPCPFLVSAGSWLSWTSWTKCTVTCGGGERIRSRQCKKGDGGLDCVGVDKEELDCNTFQCPDCTRICLGGTLSDSCTYCQCANQFEGIVRSSEGNPLDKVEIAMSETPYQILNTTNTTGHFILNELCDSHEVIFQRKGFIATTYKLSLSSGLMEIELRKEGALVMSVHPANKNRLVGNDVTLCCKAAGNPMPRFYEWFKDGKQIPGESGSTLSLSAVTRKDTGSYRCRANTVSSGLYSSEATLTIRDNPDDFCSQTTQPKYQKLPNGCSINGQDVIDIGTCAKRRCSMGSAGTEFCDDPDTYCCTATKFQKQVVYCEGFDLDLYQTVACGCSKCTTPVVEIQGFVLSGQNKKPLADVDIFYNRTKIATTSSNGQFLFSVPHGTLRVALTAKPPLQSSLTDGTSVLTLTDDDGTMYYTTINLIEVTTLDPIDSTMDQTISISSGDSTIEADFPANAFLDAEGNLYEGPVSPHVSSLNTSNIEEMAAAPGEFSTTDANGESQLMNTFGVMWMSFTTSDGVPLKVSEEVTMVVPGSMLGVSANESLPDAALFVFDSDLGTWDYISAVQQADGDSTGTETQYYFTIDEIPLDENYFSIMAPASEICHSKSRIFENDKFLESDQITGAYISSFITDMHGISSYSQRVTENNNDKNGYCIAHRCDGQMNTHAGYYGYLTAQKHDNYFVPATDNTALGELKNVLSYGTKDEKLSVKFDEGQIQDDKGPFYRPEGAWYNSPNCTNAPFSDRHFRFYSKKDTCYREQVFKFDEKLTSSCQPHYYKSWYSGAEQESNNYTTCYIRVKVSSMSVADAKVQVFSRIGTMQFKSSSDEILPGNNYGFHENCTSSGMLCLKIKPPGARQCSTNTKHDKDDLYTLVTVTALDLANDLYLNVSHIHKDFSEQHTVLQHESSFTFRMMSGVSTGGIYCATKPGMSPSESIISSFQSCSTDNEDEFAVDFGGCRGEVVLILDAGLTVPTEEIGSVWEMMFQIPRNLTISQANIRVSFIVTSFYYGVIWDLDSVYTSSSEVQELAFTYPSFDEADIANLTSERGLQQAYHDILSNGRPGVERIITMFWDGGEDLSTEVAGFDSNTHVISVVPSSHNNTFAESIVTTDESILYLQQHTPDDLVKHIKSLLLCE